MFIEDKKFIEKIILIVVMCVAFVVSLFLYSGQLEKNLNEVIKGELTEVAGQSYAYMNSVLKAKMNALEEIAGTMRSENEVSLDRRLWHLAEISEKYSFKRMGIINSEGKAYTSDNKVYDASEEEYFIKAIAGESCISQRCDDVLDEGAEIIAFSTPIDVNEGFYEVIFATYDIEGLENTFNIEFFDGNGYFFIVDKDGNAVLDTAGDNAVIKGDVNIFEEINQLNAENVEVTAQMKNCVANNESQIFTFLGGSRGKDKYVYMMPLDINDWYLMGIVTEDAISSNKNFIMRNTYILCIAIVIFFVIILAYTIRNEKRKNQRLKEIAYVDSLTGGYSYQKFSEEAEKSLLRNLEKKAAFVVLDIDEFKIINEIYGYDTGDDVLKLVFERIRENIDASTEVYARKDADNFVVLLYYKDEKQLADRLNDFCNQIQNCYLRKSKGYILRPKMGVYYIKDKRESLKSMYNYAIIAQKLVKGKNEGDVAYYTNEYSQQIIKNKFIEDDMEYAYENKEFIVYYQPKYAAKNQRITGAEALIRWKSGKTGQIISPGVFIPVAEKNGFVIKLDEFVFEEVCRQQKELIEMGIDPVPVSVNVSQKHLYYDDFVDKYNSILDKVGIDGRYVQLEITESAMFENRTKILSIIEGLKTRNFKILMDDFGTGYSSLMMLKSVPIDVMKLDKSFVDDYNQEKGEMIIKCVIRLAKEMQISITAEGVETEEQFQFLKNLECDDIQGFYFARPMAAENYIDLLRAELDK